MFIVRVKQNILPSCLLVPCSSREQRAESRHQTADSREQTPISFYYNTRICMAVSRAPENIFCVGDHETALIGNKDTDLIGLIYNLSFESLCQSQTVCVCHRQPVSVSNMLLDNLRSGFSLKRHRGRFILVSATSQKKC